MKSGFWLIDHECSDPKMGRYRSIVLVYDDTLVGQFNKANQATVEGIQNQGFRFLKRLDLNEIQIPVETISVPEEPWLVE